VTKNQFYQRISLQQKKEDKLDKKLFLELPFI